MRVPIHALPVLVAILLVSPVTIRSAPVTPEERYAALLADFNMVSGGLREATTDRDRASVVEGLVTLPEKFVALAEELSETSPGDPIVRKVLRQAIQSAGTADSAALIAWESNETDFPAGCDGAPIERTVSLLLRDHVLGEEIAPLCDRLRYSYRSESEAYLQAVLDENPHPDLRGVACLSLARYLKDRLRAVQLAEDRVELEDCFENVFGPDYLPYWRRREADGLAETIEALFARAAEDFADVSIPIGGTVGEQARSELYDLRHLAVGKPAPEITGRDQDGVDLRLTEYRGKVVLLYFWLEF